MPFLDCYPVTVSEPECHTVKVRLLGTGATAPTKVYGRGVTVAYSAVGVYTLTFPRSPGSYVGCAFGLDGATPGNLKNHSVVCTATSSTVITVNFYNAAGTARDLAATEFITLNLDFETSNA